MEVKVDTLDNVVGNLNPILMKIDVEGFETEVLNGGINVLSNSSLLGIIIELNGSGNRSNYDENAIHEKLVKLVLNLTIMIHYRKLSILNTYGSLNTIYLRNLEFVTNRVTSAKR
ncbi:MAG: FkbM family methyltransferase [Saprospiraceae bacterium]|nr:FkbM family methyltransferase [Saprospiraceae bacterium]